MTEQEYKTKKKEIFEKWTSLKQRDIDLDNLVRQAHSELKVGDGVTVVLYSDRHAYTVIKRTPCTITIQRDKATLSDDFKPDIVPGGFCGHCVNQDEQTYTYERDEHGSKLTLHFSKKYGRFMYLNKYILIGRHEFYDYNF